MKITDLLTVHIRTQSQAGKWKAVKNGRLREIYHYNTLMCILDGELFYKVSNGWGSVSDKQGLNKLFHHAEVLGYNVNRELEFINDRETD
jgi:hypothetical protein